VIALSIALACLVLAPILALAYSTAHALVSWCLDTGTLEHV
jgi:hypothetical protein